MKILNTQINFWLLSIILAAGYVFPAAAKDPRGINGIYTGTIHTDVEVPLTIPLQVALTVTGETVITQTGPQMFEERNVIDGAFVVDDEGGPYGFSLVSYNLDLSQIDMRYNRLDATLGQVAASFRLVGNIDAEGKIKGRVLSGLRGPIGVFELSPSPAKILHANRKYEGTWRGIATRFPGGDDVPLEIGLSNATRTRNNPPTYEFTFTPGKMGYVAWNGRPAFFNQISIDYLRKQVAFSDTDLRVNGQVSAATCSIDPVSGDLVGTLYGVFRGKVATFRLPRVEH